ncbi:P-loop containing nucleoside triphosphate hydrolase protein [Coniochaeta sp. 2T2.1]|nr:P-loop containing nucleoside triphosphate hydrolase protein [Coniochaeta sp. 2T2.1]
MWSIKGLTKPLHHYQLFGAGWMLHRELHPDGPFGGILADSVGLGKTIEALACILGNRRPDEEKSDTKLGTLIVVPPNLLAQWQDETDVCCPDLRVTRYHSSKHNRVRMSDLLRADIVLTSYYEVMKAYPNKDKLKEWRDLPEAERSEKFEQALGWLFGIEWHRVILDEAHCIKNSRTHTFNACSQLRGKYRWAMTATPVHNGLQEVYPYAKFLRESNAESFKDVKHKNPVRRTEAKQQMQKWLDEVMMIRHIQTLFMGKALFKIPKTNPLPNIWIKLSEEEFFIYRYYHTYENMTPEEKKACKLSFLVLAIRLRQAVTHPFLLFLMMRDLFELEDVQLIRRELEQIRLRHPDRPFIEQIGSWGFISGTVTHATSESQSRPRNRRDKDWNADMPGNDYKEYQPMGDEEGGRFLEECDKNVNLALTPSAKTTVVKNLILDWQRDHPDDKIIVFTQWVLLGRILGRVLQQEGINFLYYFGEMSREEKEDNVKVFHNVPDVKVMVASLKCGGQGLNLTCANRVILIDPWWNSALEHQAYGRVFRMGQPKETYFVRLLTKKTIDGRMAKLQHKKLIEIKEMIKPYDTTQRNPKFREVVELFGRVECDKNGKMVAVVDDYDSDDEDTPVNVPNGLGRMGMGLRRGGRVAVGNGEGSNAAADGREDDIDELLDMPRELGPGDSRVGGYGIQDL